MKRLALFISSILFFTAGYSQTWKFRRYEVWGAVSVYQYFGDIGGGASKNNLMGLRDFSFTANRPGISFGGIYRCDEKWYIQASNSFGFFVQTDKGSRNSSRNFAFSTIVDEISVQGVYFFVKENEKNYYYSIWNIGSRGFKRFNSPLYFYAFAGVAGIYFKATPKASFQDSPRFVGNKYAAFAFPIGFGAKFAFSPEFSFGLELGGRFTTTDFLDGLTSVQSKHNDIYYIFNVKAIYRLPKSKQVRRLFR